MPLTTAFTRFFGIERPVALAPMGGSAGGGLAAAVSEAGGLGLVGGGNGARDWLERELPLAAARTSRPWGVGFQSWAAAPDTVAWALEQGPRALMLSFGDPGPLARLARAAHVPLIVQVTTLDEARQALDLGADLLVAQGAEAGGHGGARATLPFVPAVVDLAAEVPVLAAGGIADGRGLAAALVLGAAGALIGTRFQTAEEALVPERVVAALLAGHGEDTERSRVLDIARAAPWPARYTARTLRNAFLEQWRDREEELSGDAAARAAFREATARGDLDAVPVWAGEGLDLVTDTAPAAELLARITARAERALAAAGR